MGNGNSETKTEKNLSIILAETSLPATELDSIRSGFEEFEFAVSEWTKRAENIVVTDESQIDLITQAKEGKKILQSVRSAINIKHQELKAVSLKKGQALDAIKRYYLSLIEPVELHLEKQAKFVEMAEDKRKAEKLLSRKEGLFKYLDPEQVAMYNLNIMSDEAFNSLLINTEKAYLENERIREQLELDRVAKEKLEREENEKMKKENELLRIKMEVIRKKELEDKQAQDKAEADIRAKHEAELKVIRDANAKLEQDILKKKELEDKQKADENAKQEALNAAPDKAKLKIFASSLLNIDYPEVESDEAKNIVLGIQKLMEKVNIYIIKNIELITVHEE